MGSTDWRLGKSGRGWEEGGHGAGRRGACAQSGPGAGTGQGRAPASGGCGPREDAGAPGAGWGSPCGPGEDRTCGGRGTGAQDRARRTKSAGQKPGVAPGSGGPVGLSGATARSRASCEKL